MWNEPYARCVAKNDTAAIAQLESSYLDAASADADFRRAMQSSLQPRHPLRAPHAHRRIRRPHASASAQPLPQQRLHLHHSQEAENDPFYASSHRSSLPDQPDSLEGTMHARIFRPRPAQTPFSIQTPSVQISSQTFDRTTPLHWIGAKYPDRTFTRLTRSGGCSSILVKRTIVFEVGRVIHQAVLVPHLGCDRLQILPDCIF